MRSLSLEEAAHICQTSDLGSFFASVDWQYPDSFSSYVLPKDSGAKVGLARVIANLLLDRGPTVLWITQTGIWPSSEHMDLLIGYRLSHGEKRTVREAPAHFFESREHLDEFISVLSLGLFFVWDLEIMSLDRSLAMTVSHDEWIEYRFAPGHEKLASAVGRYLDELMTHHENRR